MFGCLLQIHQYWLHVSYVVSKWWTSLVLGTWRAHLFHGVLLMATLSQFSVTAVLVSVGVWTEWKVSSWLGHDRESRRCQTAHVSLVRVIWFCDVKWSVLNSADTTYWFTAVLSRLVHGRLVQLAEHQTCDQEVEVSRGLTPDSWHKAV